MKKIVVSFMAIFALVFAGLGAVPSSATDKPKNLICSSTAEAPLVGTFKNVKVKKGDSCYIIDSTITGNVLANGAVDVSIIDTAIGHNVNVNAASGDVYVGSRGCKYDPVVGNNVKVHNSHNVLICWVSADNNIMAKQNDGRVTVKNSSAGNNIMVTNQDPYVSDGGDTDHRNPDYVRIIKSTYGNHVKYDNPERPKTVLKEVSKAS